MKPLKDMTLEEIRGEISDLAEILNAKLEAEYPFDVWNAPEWHRILALKRRRKELRDGI